MGRLLDWEEQDRRNDRDELEGVTVQERYDEVAARLDRAELAARLDRVSLRMLTGKSEHE